MGGRPAGPIPGQPAADLAARPCRGPPARRCPTRWPAVGTSSAAPGCAGRWRTRRAASRRTGSRPSRPGRPTSRSRAAELAVADPAAPRLGLRRRVLRGQELAGPGGRQVGLPALLELTQAHRRRRFRSPWDRAYTLFWQQMQGRWRLASAGAGPLGLRAGLRAGRGRAAAGPDPRQRLPDARCGRPGEDPRRRHRAAPIKLVWDAHEFLPGAQAVAGQRPLAARATWRTSGSTPPTPTP